MITGIQPTASLTFAASFQTRRKRLAEQERGKLFGERGLADPGRSDQQNGVREFLEPLSEQLLSYHSIPL